MTENEAIEFLKGKYPSWGCDEDEYENAITAIQALEEIQQYRAIGTVEEFRKLRKMFGDDFSEMSEVVKRILKEYPKYQSIGTIEEFKALKEKSVAKKPILTRSMMTKKEFQICPVCERLVLYDGIKFDYCQYCGQKLDWSE